MWASVAPSLPISVLLLLLAIGMGAVAWRVLSAGLRGRQTDDHPVCRRCGFDLWGTPAGTTRCGECGADLSQPRNVRVGHRERVVWKIIAGLMWGLAAAGNVAVVGVGWAVQIDWQSRLPLWWVLREATASDPAVRALAMRTLDARYSGKQLSAGQVDALVARALDVQADLNQPWDPQWGDWVQTEHDAGHLPADIWARYARQAVPQMTPQTRARIHRGDAMPFSVQSPPQNRVGHDCNLALHSTSEPGVLCIDGMPIPDAGSILGGIDTLGMPLGGGVTWERLDPLLDRLRDGPHTLQWHDHLELRDDSSADGPVVAAVDRGGSTTFELTSQPTVTLRHDPALRPVVDAALRMKGLKRVENQPKYVSFTLEAHRPPVTLDFDVVLHAGGKEWDCGHWAFHGGQDEQQFFFSIVPGLPDAVTAVDVEVRPDPAEAARSLFITEIWDEPTVFKDVSLPGPATRP